MPEYLQRINSRISDNLERFRSTTTSAAEEFSKNPLKYSENALRDIVKDYWDVGAAVLTGLAINDTNNNIFGD